MPSLFSITSERVREALRQDLKASRYSREQISIDLSRVTGRKYSVAMLDAFIAESKPHRFPAELVPAWCTTLQSTRLLDAIAGELGLSLASEQDRQFAELGRVHLKQQQLTQTLWGPTR